MDALIWVGVLPLFASSLCFPPSDGRRIEIESKLNGRHIKISKSSESKTEKLDLVKKEANRMADTLRSKPRSSESKEERKERLGRINKELNQELIFKGYPRLELHKIIVDHIAGDETKFNNIYSTSALSFNDPLYRRKDGEKKIPLGKPLRLCGPSRPPCCDDPIGIYIGPLEWKWVFSYCDVKFGNRNYDTGPIWKEVVARNGSKARVFFERIVRSVEAHIEITFCFEDLGLQIQGEIFATTNGNPDTKRLLVCLGDEDTSVKPDTLLPLDRKVVALPIKSALHLSFHLTLKEHNRKIQLELDDSHPVFEVPESVKEDSREIQVKVGDSMEKKLHPSKDYTIAGIPEDFKIKIKIAWSNDMTCYFDDDEIAEFEDSAGESESEYAN